MVNFTPEQLTAEKMINKCHHCPTDNCYLITKSLTKKSKINRKKYIVLFYSTSEKKIYSSSSSSSVSSEKLANESSSTTSFNFNVFWTSIARALQSALIASKCNKILSFS